MPASTIYDVRLRFLLEDRATRGVTGLGAAADRASRSTGLLEKSFGRLAAIGAGFLGFRAAKNALIDFNSGMEQARLKTAGLLQLNLGGDFNAHLATSNRLIAELQQRAKTSTATTAEFVGFMGEIVQPVTAAGLATKDLAEFTAQAVVAAKAFGDEETAAFDVQQALTKGVEIQDRFTRKLLGALKLTNEEFNKLSQGERLATLQRALRLPAIQELAKAQESSFAGVFSTFQDNLQLFLGKVGLPLFQAITAEIQKWNAWIEANTDTINQFAQRLAGALTSAFVVVKDIAAFVVEHSDALLFAAKSLLALRLGSAFTSSFVVLKDVAATFVEHSDALLFVAKSLLALQLGRSIGAQIGNLGGSASRLTRQAGGVALAAGFDRAGLGMAKFGVGMGAAVGALGRFIPLVGLAGIALEGLFTLLSDQEEDRRRQEERDRAAKAAAEFQQPEVFERLERLRALQERATRGGGPSVLPMAEQIELENLIKEIAPAVDGIREWNRRVVDSAVKFGIIDKNLSRIPESRAVEDFIAAQKFTNAEANKVRAAFAELQMATKFSANAQADLERMLRGEFIPTLLEIALGARGLLLDQRPVPTAAETEAAMAQKRPAGARVDVRIQKIEVQSEDPDRFVFGLVEAFRDAAKNPSSALDTFREG